MVKSKGKASSVPKETCQFLIACIRFTKEGQVSLHTRPALPSLAFLLVLLVPRITTTHGVHLKCIY